VTTSSHGIGDLFIVGGVLYKATDTIASGETIVVGENVTVTTIDAEIAAKADAENPTFTGSISMGRKSDTNVGTGSFACGNDVEATAGYSHAEGRETKATNLYAHAEGYLATASGTSSHAEGIMTTASGVSSHAEGDSNTASGEDSHAEGNYTTASGKASHAEGTRTIAACKSQHVFGEYNIADEGYSVSKGTYVEIVGNGLSVKARSNARTLDWNGNESLAGSLTLGKGTANETTITAAQLKALIALLS
jgi:hypothetical protein